MTKYLAGVLSVIAGGVLLVAYGLLSPRATAMSYPNQNPYATQAAFSAQPAFNNDATVPCANGNPYVSYGMTAPVAQPVRYETIERAPVVRRTEVRTTVRTPRRDWKKTALVVGGSTATAAGLGGLIGGKKGALVGAALGGGISTLYETTHR